MRMSFYIKALTSDMKCGFMRAMKDKAQSNYPSDATSEVKELLNRQQTAPADAEISAEQAAEVLQERWRALNGLMADKIHENLSEANVGVELAAEGLAALKKIRDALKLLDKAVEEAESAEAWFLGADFDIERAGRSGLGTQIGIFVTEGMISISALSLTHAVKQGVLHRGQALRVTLPNGQSFETTIDSPGNRLKERGKIAAFFKMEGVTPNTWVYLKEYSRGEWLLYGQNSKEAKKDQAAAIEEVAPTITVAANEQDAFQDTPKKRQKCHVTIDWTKAGRNLPPTVIEGSNMTDAFVGYLSAICAVLGAPALKRLSAIRTGRGPLITDDPSNAYRYRSGVYPHRKMASMMGYFVLTNNDNPEKIRLIAQAARAVELPKGSVKLEFAD